MAKKALGQQLALGLQDVPDVPSCRFLCWDTWESLVPGGHGFWRPANSESPMSPVRPWTTVALVALGVVRLLETSGSLGVIASHRCILLISVDSTVLYKMRAQSECGVARAYARAYAHVSTC